MTNYERIKNMDIEQMAIFMEQVKMRRLNAMVFTCRPESVEDNQRWLESEAIEIEDEDEET